MKRVSIFALMIAIVLGGSVHAQAELLLLGQGTSAHGSYNMIYDTVQDITWHDFTTSQVSWQAHMDWAGELSVSAGSNVYDDWRLPYTFDQNCNSYNCINSELGHLYYTGLGNLGFVNEAGQRQSDWGLNNTGLFQNLNSNGTYWSGTDYVAAPEGAWSFSFYDGYQGSYLEGSHFFSVAVHDGKLAVVPEPVSSTLFLVGSAALGFRRFRRSVWCGRTNIEGSGKEHQICH